MPGQSSGSSNSNRCLQLRSGGTSEERSQGGVMLLVKLFLIYLCFCLTDDCSNSVEILASHTENPPPLRIWKIKEGRNGPNLCCRSPEKVNVLLTLERDY